MMSWLYQVFRVVSQVGVLRLIGEMNLYPFLRTLSEKVKNIHWQYKPCLIPLNSFCYRPDYWATASN